MAKRLGGLWDGITKHQAGSVWDINEDSPTIDTMLGGGREPHILEIWNVTYINDRETKRIRRTENRLNSFNGNRGGGQRIQLLVEKVRCAYSIVI